MTRQLEYDSELIAQRRAGKAGKAILWELDGAIQHAGGILCGLTFKIDPGEVLLVVKVELAGRRQVAFVGAEDMAGCLIKAVRGARADSLNWRADKYVGQS